MTCLNDSHIQALADGEGSADARHHALECAPCAARVETRAALMAGIAQAFDVPAGMPEPLVRRMESSLRQGGATRLRESNSGRGWLYGGLGVAAATLIAVLFVLPMVKSPDATVSASEILAKSATQLSAPVASGIETLEYELVLDGVPKEMMPDTADGTYRVRQVIDHNAPGRFRFATFGPDGAMLSSIAQDPQRNQRVMAFTSEGQPYRFEVSLPAKSGGLSLPEMERLHMQASITMMQAGGNQRLETIDGPNGRLYRIEAPRVSDPGTNSIWDLSEARVLIDARDYRVTEFAVSGTFLKQAYSLSYRLISRAITPAVRPDAFLVPAQPGEIVIKGEGSSMPTHDVMLLALRELTRAKQGQ